MDGFWLPSSIFLAKIFFWVQLYTLVCSLHTEFNASMFDIYWEIISSAIANRNFQLEALDDEFRTVSFYSEASSPTKITHFYLYFRLLFPLLFFQFHVVSCGKLCRPRVVMCSCFPLELGVAVFLYMTQSVFVNELRKASTDISSLPAPAPRVIYGAEESVHDPSNLVTT
jgi:hypothetical protein